MALEPWSVASRGGPGFRCAESGGKVPPSKRGTKMLGNSCDTLDAIRVPIRASNRKGSSRAIDLIDAPYSVDVELQLSKCTRLSSMVAKPKPMAA